MKAHKTLIALLISACITSATAASDEKPGTATLELQEVLRLHDLSRTPEQVPKPPPLGYAISHFDATGRIIGDSVEAKAMIRLSVFSDEWIQVPLLEAADNLDITELPEVVNAHFAYLDGSLALITKTPGEYHFTLGLKQRAQQKDGQWQFLLKTANAGVQRMQLKHDPALFQVTDPQIRRKGDTLIVHGKQGTVALSWKALHRMAQQSQAPSLESQYKEPAVTRGTANIVVTMDGQHITRAFYDLTVQGKQRLEVVVPSSESLHKIYLNGVSQAIQWAKTATEGEKVALIDVSPPRPGDENASLELVLKHTTSAMDLAGQLEFRLPRLSWGINDLYCALFLPEVFNYQWSGGSLAPDQQRVLPHYTYSIPTPGKRLSARQQLVSNTPNIQVAYTVDLKGQYLR